jgi:hypothetical protein
MNRIILIGNGFDKAHGLPTGYPDFMDWYWRELALKLTTDLFFHEDELIKFERISGPETPLQAMSNTRWPSTENRERYCYDDGRGNGIIPNIIRALEKIDSYQAFKAFKELLVESNDASDLQFQLSFKNNFWEHISERRHLQNWVDIENEYYTLLKSYLNKENRNELVKKLNGEFCQIKNLLEKYLTEVCKQDVTTRDSIEKALRTVIMYNDVAISKRNLFLDSVALEMKELDELPDIDNILENRPKYLYEIIKDKIKEKPSYGYIGAEQTLFVNFNYTNTVGSYSGSSNDVINIHGKLKSVTNRIIFGYGDELDDDYREIEKTNDNDFLENIKSIHYHNTGNYRRLLEFLQWEPYQVYVMGHSCGNSDRTLLNTIFEHENCISIKPFYHQWKDEDSGEMMDNYTDLVKNISRNFNNKQNLRDIVVNKKDCKPLVPHPTL